MKDTWKNVSAWLHSNLKNYQFIAIRKWWYEAECFWKASDLKPTLVHGDLWYSNVLIDKKNDVSGIIDFGSALIGDKTIDFAVQNYISNQFRIEVINEYVSLGGVMETYLEERMNYMLGLREICGLEYEIITNYIRPDTLKKIKMIIMKPML